MSGKASKKHSRHGQGRGHGNGQASGQGAGYWIVGRHAVLSALSNPERKVEQVMATVGAASQIPADIAKCVHISKVKPDELDRMLGKDVQHQGIAARVQPLPDMDIEDVIGAPLVVILDQVTDPHNIGAIVRSAAAFGVGAVILQDKHSPSEGATIAKVSSGGLEIVPLIRVINIADAMLRLKEEGYWCIGLDGEATVSMKAVPKYDRAALVLGAEGAGLRPKVLQTCDVVASIPMPGSMESLNVSNAAAIALYQLAAE